MSANELPICAAPEVGLGALLAALLEPEPDELPLVGVDGTEYVGTVELLAACGLPVAPASGT